MGWSVKPNYVYGVGGWGPQCAELAEAKELPVRNIWLTCRQPISVTIATSAYTKVPTQLGVFGQANIRCALSCH